jgi:glycosyltransferase involved in cell wall biosynthesis
MPSSARGSRIAIVIPNFAGGGAERVGINLANGFAARGYLVDLLVMSTEGPLRFEVESGVQVVDLGAPRIRWVPGPLLRYLRSARPRAVLGCMWPMTVVLVLARMLSRVPFRLVVAEHCTWSESELFVRPFARWKVRTSMHYALPRADAIVTVSTGAADDLSAFAGIDRRCVNVIYNPVTRAAAAFELPAAVTPEGWCTGSHHKILAVGTLKEIKDYPTLLLAFRLLRERMNARLLILGEGQCRPVLEAQCRQLGIADAVFMPGFVTDPQPYYRRADLHVLTSTAEGLGNVIIEALAAGTPVVSTDCPHGPREILADGTYGRLVPVGKPEMLASVMEESLVTSHDKAALIARGRDFSVDKAVEAYLQLLLPGTFTGSQAA